MDFESTSSTSSSSPSSSPRSISACNVSIPCNANPNPNPNSRSSALKRKAGRKKFKETRHPIYRGVRLRNGNKWVCEVREPNKRSRLWLGTYPCPKMAARAHDVAALALRGETAALNFPESSSLLPRARSSFPGDIQVAALMAADQGFCRLGDSAETVSVESNVSEEINVGVFDDVFFDEEAVFNFPNLLLSMAEGMLIAPPALGRGICEGEGELADCMDGFKLWND